MKPEGPRLFVLNTFRQFIQTVPVLPRDEIDMDDVDSAAEDHVGEAGVRPRDERKKPVPQPRPPSLSLRNKGHWKGD
jgi:hypothetical protein